MSTPRYNRVQKVAWGKTVTGRRAIMGRRTAAHLDATIQRLRKVAPTARLDLLQSAYNTSVEASAGTHDKDAVIDVRIVGMDWMDAQAFMRKCGWACWYRHPPEFAGEHLHAISLGYEPAPVGIYVPGQVTDYTATPPRSGLKGHAVDPTWHPHDIPATVFSYRRFIRFHPLWNRRHPTIQ